MRFKVQLENTVSKFKTMTVAVEKKPSPHSKQCFLPATIYRWRATVYKEMARERHQLGMSIVLTSGNNIVLTNGKNIVLTSGHNTVLTSSTGCLFLTSALLILDHHPSL